MVFEVEIGYARTSTDHQDLERQIHQLQTAGISAHLIYTDAGISGSKAPDQRPGYRQVIALIETGTVRGITLTDLSRLGRDARGTLQAVWDLQDRGIVVRSLSETDRIVLASPQELQPILTAAITLGADIQRRRTIEDTKAGQARARAAGKKIGRPQVKIDWQTLEDLKGRGISETAAIKVMGVSQASFYRAKKRRQAATAGGGI